MPEERNRIEVDRISALLFAPDERSASTLRTEGARGEIRVVGDVMADATRIFGRLARERSTILDQLGVEAGGYVVATVHREANVRPERLRRIAAGLATSARQVILPAHPRTRAALAAEEIALPAHIRVIDPLGYLDFAALASQAATIATDSGGLQKEAYWYGVPCVTMRPSTEWIDTVAVGANVLTDDDPERIAAGLATASMPPSDPCCTATAMPRSESPPSWSLADCPPCTIDVAIIGAGYVGVPLAQVFADAGRSVLLVDVSSERSRSSTAVRATSRTCPRRS